MFGTLSPVNKEEFLFNWLFVCLYKIDQMAHISISPTESVSTGFNWLDWMCCYIYTQESSGGGLLSMRPTAGLPALMKCFLSLIACVREHRQRKSISMRGTNPKEEILKDKILQPNSSTLVQHIKNKLHNIQWWKTNSIDDMKIGKHWFCTTWMKYCFTVSV